MQAVAQAVAVARFEAAVVLTDCATCVAVFRVSLAAHLHERDRLEVFLLQGSAGAPSPGGLAAATSVVAASAARAPAAAAAPATAAVAAPVRAAAARPTRAAARRATEAAAASVHAVAAAPASLVINTRALADLVQAVQEHAAAPLADQLAHARNALALTAFGISGAAVVDGSSAGRHDTGGGGDDSGGSGGDQSGGADTAGGDSSDGGGSGGYSRGSDGSDGGNGRRGNGGKCECGDATLRSHKSNRADSAVRDLAPGGGDVAVDVCTTAPAGAASLASAGGHAASGKAEWGAAASAAVGALLEGATSVTVLEEREDAALRADVFTPARRQPAATVVVSEYSASGSGGSSSGTVMVKTASGTSDRLTVVLVAVSARRVRVHLLLPPLPRLHQTATFSRKVGAAVRWAVRARLLPAQAPACRGSTQCQRQVCTSASSQPPARLTRRARPRGTSCPSA